MSDRNVIMTASAAYHLGYARGLSELSNYHISEHFTWGEVFAKETESDFRTATLTIYENAVKQSKTLEEVRRVFGGKPMTIINWYRSPAHNLRVNGSQGSFHKVGLATDFVIQGYTSVAGNKEIQKLLDKHPSFQKHGLEFTKGNWTHIDSRGYKERFYA